MCVFVCAWERVEGRGETERESVCEREIEGEKERNKWRKEGGKGDISII